MSHRKRQRKPVLAANASAASAKTVHVIPFSRASALGLPCVGKPDGQRWFIVDDTGLHYGVRLPGRKRSSVEVRISWQEIVASPHRGHDVLADYDPMNQDHSKIGLQFWRRLPSGEIALHHLPLSLLPNTLINSLRYASFHNHTDILVAILQGLAARPGLRFNPDVFVHARINPRTWQPMEHPRDMADPSVAIGAGVIMAFVAVYVYLVAEKHWPFWTIVPILIVSLVAAMLLARLPGAGLRDAIPISPAPSPSRARVSPVRSRTFLHESP